MKPSLFPLLALCLAPALLHAAPQAPAVSIDEVVSIANKALAKKGKPGVYIESIALSKPAVFSDKRVWSVRWSESLPASKPELKEIGLSIGMDGKVVHVVK